MVTNERPHPHELLEDEQALARLSGFLVTQYADKVKQVDLQQKRRVRLSFEH